MMSSDTHTVPEGPSTSSCIDSGTQPTQQKSSRDRHKSNGRHRFNGRSSSTGPVDVSRRIWITLWTNFKRELSPSSGNASTLKESDLDQIVSFLVVPFSLEKVLFFGFLTCLDAFLYFFTILPLRFARATYRLLTSLLSNKTVSLQPSQSIDITKGVILISTVYLLSGLNASILYHNIRGQSAVKLYVMFNVLEVGDKLFCSLGQDIMEVLFSNTTLQRPIRLYLFISLAIFYNLLHAAALFCQMITLNVAVNSYSNALLTLLLSNQFGEIKSTVFKKFERENLFQLTCADISERFQLWVMLLIIGLRNIVEISASSTGIIPQSWKGMNTILGAFFGPAIVVLGSEICVDWLKHSYIAKFNKLKPKVYNRFLDVFCRDLLRNGRSGQINLTKRLGVPLIPLVCVFVKSTTQTAQLILSSHPFLIPTRTTVAQLAAGCDNGNERVIPRATGFEGNLSTTGMVLEYAGSYMMSTIEASLYACVIFTIFAIFVLLKLALGTVLLEYSRHRLDIQQLKDAKARQGLVSSGRNREPFADEKVNGERKGGVWGLIDMGDGIREEVNELDEEDKQDLQKQGKDKKTFTDLHEIERFNMVAKRIW
ncbi:eukaryotic membrane protein family-domain-containing protein [Lipomyces kononenkoae]|uniref:Eukaryotic membrane protein family-domain-containing protein n=1 Tax=Lipomyces kononenkoae TaxID=34357 RepID=A0ACC3T0E3_LIPKO